MIWLRALETFEAQGLFIFCKAIGNELLRKNIKGYKKAD